MGSPKPQVITSEKEQLYRQAAVNFANANIGLEGFEVDSEQRQRQLDYINSKLTLTQLINTDYSDTNTTEASVASNRIIELIKHPVQGLFDASHLKEIHRRIFQDMVSVGINEYYAGQFRKAVPEGHDWIKYRSLKSAATISTVAYSRMDKSAISSLNQLLATISINEIKQLNTAQFTQYIAELYTKLDYIHPFSEGNSRTLRLFTYQLATAAEKDLDWIKFNTSQAGRDILAIARDLSVNELATPHLIHIESKRDVMASQDTLDGNKNLADLLSPTVN